MRYSHFRIRDVQTNRSYKSLYTGLKAPHSDKYFTGSRQYRSGSILSVESNQSVESKTDNVENKIAFVLQEISYFEP